MSGGKYYESFLSLRLFVCSVYVVVVIVVVVVVVIVAVVASLVNCFFELFLPEVEAWQT